MNGNESLVRDDATRRALIIEHLPLVKYCVGRMHVKRAFLLDYEDLIGHGTLGLIQAVDRFDETKGAKFSNFALTRIRGAVLDAMRAIDPVGRTTRQAGRHIAVEFNNLALELGRDPTAVEVQAATHLSYNRYWDARAATEMRELSIDTPNPGGQPLYDSIDNDSPAASTAMEDHDLQSALAAAIRSLPPRDQFVLDLYFREGLTLEGVAKVMDISQSRVSQLLSRAYTRLRADLALTEAKAA